MRPNSTMFNTQALSEPYLALAKQLKDGGEAAPPETLPLVTAARELAAAARSSLDGRGMESRADRESLRDDVRRSVDAAGTEVSAVFSAAIFDLKTQFGDLPELFTTLPGATIVLGIAEALLRGLRTPDAAAAGWRDVVQAFEKNDSPESCELAVAQLKAIMVEQGHDWDERAGKWAGILCDWDYMIARARGEEERVPRLEPAGSSIEERLAICETIAREAVPAGRVVVWLAYSNASLPNNYLALSGVEIFDGSLWHDEHVLIEGPWPRPPELDIDVRYRGFLHRRPAEDFVFLRVNLGHSGIMTARKRARQIAETLPSLVTTSSSWRLMDGEILVVDDGNWSGSVFFEDPIEKTLRLSQFARSDPTGSLLMDESQKLVSDLVNALPEASELAEGFRWRTAVRQLPNSAQRVALTVQAIERQFIPAAKEDKPRWDALLARYFKTHWSWSRLGREVWDVGYFGTQPLLDGPLEIGGSQTPALRAALVQQSVREINVDTAETVRRAAELGAQLDAGSIERRMVAEVERCAASTEYALLWLDRLEARFDVLLARAIRVRNAITHGGRTVDSVTDSVDTFVAALETLVLGARLYAIEEDTPLAAVLQRWRVFALEHRRRLEAGEDFDSVVASLSTSSAAAVSN